MNEENKELNVNASNVEATEPVIVEGTAQDDVNAPEVVVNENPEIQTATVSEIKVDEKKINPKKNIIVLILGILLIILLVLGFIYLVFFKAPTKSTLVCKLNSNSLEENVTLNFENDSLTSVEYLIIYPSTSYGDIDPNELNDRIEQNINDLYHVNDAKITTDIKGDIKVMFAMSKDKFGYNSDAGKAELSNIMTKNNYQCK